MADALKTPLHRLHTISKFGLARRSNRIGTQQSQTASLAQPALVSYVQHKHKLLETALKMRNPAVRDMMHAYRGVLYNYLYACCRLPCLMFTLYNISKTAARLFHLPL